MEHRIIREHSYREEKKETSGAFVEKFSYFLDQSQLTLLATTGRIRCERIYKRNRHLTRNANEIELKYTNLLGFHRVIRFPESCLIAVTHVRDVAKAATLLVTKYI